MTENKYLNMLSLASKEDLNKYFEIIKDIVGKNPLRTDDYYIHYNILSLIMSAILLIPSTDKEDVVKESLEFIHTNDANPYYNMDAPIENLEVKSIKDVNHEMKVVEVALSGGKLVTFAYSKTPKDISSFKKSLFEDNDVSMYIDSYSDELAVGYKIPARILVLGDYLHIVEFDGVSMLDSMFKDIEDIGFAETYIKRSIGPYKE